MDNIERHARETLAIIGKTMNVSRETIRKAKVCNNTFIDAEKLLMSGEMRVSKMHSLAIGDNRAGLFVKIQPETKEKLKIECKRTGLTMGEYIEYVLTQIFGEVG